MADINWADFKPAPDQDVSALIGAITHVESGGDANAVSSQGAVGSMQIIPATFQQYALPGEDFGNDAHRSAAAVRKIVDDYVHFGGDAAKTAAAYIGGRGAVRSDGSIRDDVADANGTTPAAYAGMVLGRMRKGAVSPAAGSVDWSQFKPAADEAPQAGGGRGFANPAAVDPNAPPPNAAPPQAFSDPMGSSDFAAVMVQPPKRASVLEGVQLPEPTMTPSDEAENERLSQRSYAERTPTVDDPRQFAPSMTATPAAASTLTGPQKREVGLLQSLGRGFGRAGAQTALMPALIVSASGVALDKLRSAVTGNTQTGAQDWMFHNLVDPRQQAVDWYALAPDEKQGFLGKVADSVGAMVQDLPLMVASGGLKQRQELAQQFPTLLRFLEDSVGQGFDAMRPIMVKAGTEKAKQVLDAGGTTAQAMNSATVAALWTGLSGSQPMSAAGSIPSRIATGVPVGMAQEEAGRVVQNAADPAGLQRPFDAAEMVAGGVTNAIAAGAMGHGVAGRAPDRIALGYEPMTGKTPVAEAVQGMGEPMLRPGPVGAEPARDHVADILNAGSVEEAAQSALKVAERPGTVSVADEMRAIRPQSPVELNETTDGSTEGNADERASAEVPPAAAGAAGGGRADAAAGLGVRDGSDAVPRAAVESAGPAGEAAAGPVPLGHDGGADALAPAGPRPYRVERTASGSLIVRGDKAAIREALANLPPDVVVPTKGGMQVSTNWSERAERVLQQFDPTAYADLNGKKVAIKVQAEDGTQATLKLDAGRALRATDARERELERLRQCVGGAA